MKEYVEFNSLHHSQAQNDFDVDFNKLLLNSLFGKIIKNPKKRTKVKLYRTKQEFERSMGKPTFKRSKIINESLVGVEMKYSSVKLNKPFYMGVAILELEKRHMYDFHYNIMKNMFGGHLHLFYTATDSLLYEIDNSVDPYSEILSAGYNSHFDFSNFPTCHPMYDVSHKCVPGTFKDECIGTMYISEFVGLRSKMYSLLFDDGKSYTRTKLKVAKGIKSCVILNCFAFADYIQCMLEDEVMEHSFKSIRSVTHDMHKFEQSKVTLSLFDDNHYLLNLVHSIPYGHYQFLDDVNG